MEITDEHYAMLGRIAVTAGRLEFTVGVLVGDLIDPNFELSRRLTADMPFARRLTAAVDLAKARLWDGDPRVRELKRLAQRARASMQQRNELLHGHWASVDEQGRAVARVMVVRKRGVSYQLFTSGDELAAVLSALLDVSKDFDDFYSASLEWSGAFRKTSDGGYTRIGY